MRAQLYGHLTRLGIDSAARRPLEISGFQESTNINANDAVEFVIKELLKFLKSVPLQSMAASGRESQRGEGKLCLQ